MPPQAFQADALQVEPGSGQTLKITRDIPTGSMRFQDAVIPAGVNLSDLASLNSIVGLLVVGRAGSGAKYLTIQSALNAIPSTASANNPYTILCFPGIYLENIIIDKDGVSIVAIGQVSIVAVSNTPTVSIQAAVLTTPLTTVLQGLKIQTSFTGRECVLVQGGPGLSVGLSGVVLKGCNLAAKGVGSYTVRANIVNSVSLLDCVSDESDATAILGVSQCASVVVSGGTHPAAQLDYDTGGATPITAGSTYTFNSCRSVGPILSTLVGAGTLKIQGSPSVGNVTLNGNRTGLIQGSSVGNLSIGGTSVMTMVNSTRGSLVGTGQFDEPNTSGTVVFAASASEAVLFSVPRTNANYNVFLDTGTVDPFLIASKTINGFTITFGGVQTRTVSWTILAR